jgi:hypothetical protein
MFKYPATMAFALKNRAKLVKSEQNCLECRKWFETTDAMRAMLSDIASREAAAKADSVIAFSIPFTDVICPHCGKKTILIDPGKYDSMNAKNPGQQRYVFDGLRPRSLARPADPMGQLAKAVAVAIAAYDAATPDQQHVTRGDKLCDCQRCMLAEVVGVARAEEGG